MGRMYWEEDGEGIWGREMGRGDGEGMGDGRGR